MTPTSSSPARALRLALVPLLALTAARATAQSWSAPTTVASSPAALHEPAVAANGSGLVSTAWTAGGRVQARLRIRNVWSPATALSPANVMAREPVTSVGPNGDVVVAWSEGASGAQRMRAAFFSGGRWSPATSIAGPTLRISSPRVKFNARNDAILVWSQGAADGSCAAWSSVGRPGPGWSTPLNISGTSGCWGWVRLAAASTGSGEAIAAFSNARPALGGGAAVWVATRNGQTGAWSAPEMVADATYRSGAPAVAIAENGLAILTWADAYGPLYSRRAPDRTWTIAAPIDEISGTLYTGLNDVAMDAAGNAVAALGAFDVTQTFHPVRAARLNANSNRWTATVPITSEAATCDQFQIAASPLGTFVVGWVDGEYDMTTWLPVGAGVSTLAPGSLWRRQAFRQGDEAIAAAAATGTGIVVWNSATTTPSTVRASTSNIR